MCIICFNYFYSVEYTRKRHYTKSSFCPMNCSCILHCRIHREVLLSATWKAVKIINSNLISVQPHRSTRFWDVVTLPRAPSSLKVNHRSFRHASSVSSISFPRYFACLLIKKTSLIWSHTRQFGISFITTVTIHYSLSLPLQAPNSSFSQSHKSFPP